MLGLYKEKFSIPNLTLQLANLTLQPAPPVLHPEVIAFFALKSQNKKGVLRLTNMSYTMSLLSIIYPKIYQDLPSPAVGSAYAGMLT